MSDARDTTMATIQATIEEDTIPGLDQVEERNEAEQLDAAAETVSPVDQVKANLAREKQETKDAAERDKQERDLAKRELDASEKLAEIAADTYEDIHQQATRTADRVGTFAGGLWDSLARIPAPGTIFLPVAILLILFFLLLPVNGHPRGAWLIMALTGSAEVG